MQRYEVRFTPQAAGQLEETAQYIAKVLVGPEIALRWAERLKAEVAKLETLPFRHPLTEEEPWHTLDIRRMRVGNHLVYYFVDEDAEVVWVTAVIYGRRDQATALDDDPFRIE